MENKRNWADLIGTIGLIVGIINLITTILGLIPLFGLPLRILSTFGGAIALTMSILACVFGHNKRRAITGIVIGGIGLAVSLPLWIVYVIGIH